jgi:hypothetical protein
MSYMKLNKTQQAMYVQCNNVGRSLNFYTSSTILSDTMSLEDSPSMAS